MDFFSGMMAFFTLGTGLFLTVRLGFFQFTHIRKALGCPFRRSRRGRDGVTPFQAMATALGGSVGTANIAGVAGAITSGGPGAVFWMWMAGLTGMAVKLAEIMLAMKYRDTSSVPPVGGAMLYIERGLGSRAKPLSVAFAAFGCLAALLGTALVQSNTIALSGFELMRCIGSGIGAETNLICGAITALLTGAVILGGAKRIGAFSERAVPLMALLYIFASMTVILKNADGLLPALGLIIDGAFGLEPAAGGLLGFGFIRAFRIGTARGVYSNEAGVGSGAMAHAGSSETDPVRQGMLGIFEVFADTIVMCTMTALVILTSGVVTSDASVNGMALAGEAFASVFGTVGASVFLAVSVLLFAFTSLVGWSLYGERCAEYLFKGRVVLPFRIVFLLLIPLGAVLEPGSVWALGESFNYLMALPNLIALLLLSGNVKSEVRQYKMFEKSRVRDYNRGQRK